MADDIVVNIAFKGNANEFLAELSRAVGRAKTQLQEMGQSTAALSRLETQLAKMSTSANQAAQATTRAAQATKGWSQAWTPFKGQFQQAEANSKSLWRSIDQGIAASERSLGRATVAVSKYQEAQNKIVGNRVGGNPMADWDKQFAAATKAADANVAAMQRARRAVEEYQNSLSNTRYVLYDVAGTLSILGIGLVAPIAAIVGTAVKMEAAFAQVQRTSGSTGEELRNLKEDFDNLYAAIPITYDALAKIATLAGQLGVPADQITDFTEVVAKTATVTDLSVEQAATAFGRLNALIPNVKGQYDRLGSAIAKVGVNSVATESEIVNISTQISAMGSFAGLTAQDIIGLSGALASIGAQPELSRGTVTRVFTLMSRAVANGGDSLEKFAQLSGVSAQEFASGWGKPEFTNTFLGFMAGIKNSGSGAVAALNELGITSVRDVPLLLRLANAADSTGKAGALLAQTIGDANSGWAENIELQRQYAIIAATVASKFQILVNNLNLFLQAIGAPMLNGLGEFLSFLTGIVGMATDFAKTDLGGAFFRIVAVVGALAGALAIAAGAMALMGASSIGVYQALLFLAKQSPVTAAALLGTAGAAAVADGTLKAGAASALLFSRALKAISIVGALLILPEVLKVVGTELDKLAGRDFSKPGQAIEMLAKSTDLFSTAWRSGGGIVRNVGADFANSLTATGRAALELDDALKGFVAGGAIDKVVDYLNEFDAAASDRDAAGTLDLFSGVVDAAKEAGYSIKVVGGEIVNTGEKALGATGSSDIFGGSLEGIAAEAEAAKEALQGYRDELDAINGTQISASEASDRLQSSINAATEAMKAEGVSLDGVNDNSIAFRDSLREIEENARTAGEAILDNGGSVEEATAKWKLGRDAAVDLLVQMGLEPAKAEEWATAQLGSATSIVAAFDMIKAGLDAIPSAKNVTITANTAQAQGAIDQFIRWNNGKVIHITVAASPGGDFSVYGGVPRAYAGGGKIKGPGSGTSDSILARVSNDEFIIRERAARAIGYGRLDYMNRTGSLPKFAGGGRVGGGASAGMTGEIDLGPRTMRALSRQVVNMISIDQNAIADAAVAGNQRGAWRGGRRN